MRGRQSLGHWHKKKEEKRGLLCYVHAQEKEAWEQGKEMEAVNDTLGKSRSERH